jgi:hypothetical protein
MLFSSVPAGRGFAHLSLQIKVIIGNIINYPLFSGPQPLSPLSDHGPLDHEEIAHLERNDISLPF